MSPFRDKVKDREWHRAYMKKRRNVTPVTLVTPSKPHAVDNVTPEMLHPDYTIKVINGVRYRIRKE